ncbi:MAG: hypothetical protein AUG44_24505 [Actinobacteria bacterium 13_1_20CM_3_71_11]|nr:MAG: hypothetical protein AUG44_24505 [Actinobacteria bacterium 13_1_20CM_3_71_11]
MVEAAEEIAAAAAEIEAAGEALDEAEAELAEADEQLDIAAGEAAEIADAGALGEVEVVAVAVLESEGEDTGVEEEAGATFVGLEDAAEPAVSESAVLLTALAPLRPGDVSEGSIAVWKPEAVTAFREQLREVQAQFVDDPEEAVAHARALVSDAVHTLADTLLAHQLGAIDLPEHPDTESLRVALRQYREFLERVLAL